MEQQIFKAGFIEGGDLFFPQTLIIDNTDIISIKRHGLLYIEKETITMRRKQISSVQVNNLIIGCEITINSLGNDTILICGMRKRDGKVIDDILKNR